MGENVDQRMCQNPVIGHIWNIVLPYWGGKFSNSYTTRLHCTVMSLYSGMTGTVIKPSYHVKSCAV
jgi:hypothetical protein